MTNSFHESQEVITSDARNIYSEIVMNQAENPRNKGLMQDADGFAKITGPCGDTVEIWLKTENNIICRATFMTTGCYASIASSNIVTEMVKGKSVNDAQQIKQQDVLDALGGLPDKKKHCALLATDTLKAAIRSLETNKQ
jgi:nitrogen fixation NifU-like protein